MGTIPSSMRVLLPWWGRCTGVTADCAQIRRRVRPRRMQSRADASERREWQFVMAATQGLDECVSWTDHLCGPQPLQATHGPQPGRQPTVIRFDWTSAWAKKREAAKSLLRGEDVADLAALVVAHTGKFTGPRLAYVSSTNHRSPVACRHGRAAPRTVG
jgi:hypothetical protein